MACKLLGSEQPWISLELRKSEVVLSQLGIGRPEDMLFPLVSSDVGSDRTYQSHRNDLGVYTLLMVRRSALSVVLSDSPVRSAWLWWVTMEDILS